MNRPAPRQVSESWQPRHEKELERIWLTHLVMHSGEWCRASDLWEPADAYQRAVLRQLSHEVVCAAGRLGLAVESDRRRGYMVTGHLGLPRYLHVRPRTEETIDGRARQPAAPRTGH